ncbi:MAG TPA: oligosaccharide flippase family protein [Chitinophagaceae bacterium]|nr:oligosaccharide flippase family protein [Chitinophagaceae bacterium]
MSVFKRYKYWISSAKYTTVQKFMILIIGIISFMLLARMLGPEGYGVWGLFVLIAAITETTRNSLIRNAFIWFSHQADKGEQGRLQTAALFINGLLSILLAALYFFLSGLIANALNAPSLSVMLKIYSVCLLITVFFSHIETVLNAKMDFRGICWMNCFRQIVLLTGILVFYFSHLQISTVYLALIYLASVVVGSITGLIMSTKYLFWQSEGYKTWISRLWKFGRFVLALISFLNYFGVRMLLLHLFFLVPVFRLTIMQVSVSVTL